MDIFMHVFYWIYVFFYFNARLLCKPVPVADQTTVVK